LNNAHRSQDENQCNDNLAGDEILKSRTFRIVAHPFFVRWWFIGFSTQNQRKFELLHRISSKPNCLPEELLYYGEGLLIHTNELCTQLLTFALYSPSIVGEA